MHENAETAIYSLFQSMLCLKNLHSSSDYEKATLLHSREFQTLGQELELFKFISFKVVFIIIVLHIFWDIYQVQFHHTL